MAKEMSGHITSNETMAETRLSVFSMQRIWMFLILTCVLSWPVWIASGVLGRQSMVFDFPWLLAQCGVFGTSFAALIISGFTSKELAWNSLRTLPVMLLVLIVPGVIIAMNSPEQLSESGTAASVLSVIIAGLVALYFSPFNRWFYLPGTGKPQSKPSGIWILLSITLLPVMFLTGWLMIAARSGNLTLLEVPVNVGGFTWKVLVAYSAMLIIGGPLGEELGWRGFLLPELLKKFNPLAASIVLGIIWGLWHAPIDLTAGLVFSGAGAVLIRVIWALPLSVIFTWFYLRTGRNLIAALFLHASVNVLPDIGFTHYEESILLLWIFMLIVAVFVSVMSREFRGSAS